MTTQISTSWSLKSNVKEGSRVHQLWPGANRFYCLGKCISGPRKDMIHQLCPLLCMMVVLGVYFGVFAVPLAQKVTIWLPITFGIVSILTISLYFATHCTDPGIIPRRDFFTADLINREQKELGKYLNRRQPYNPQDDTAGTTPFYSQNPSANTHLNTGKNELIRF